MRNGLRLSHGWLWHKGTMCIGPFFYLLCKTNLFCVFFLFREPARCQGNSRKFESNTDPQATAKRSCMRVPLGCRLQGRRQGSAAPFSACRPWLCGNTTLFTNFRKFRETSEIDFNRHFSMKLSPQGSGERGKRPEIAFFAAVIFAFFVFVSDLKPTSFD